MDLDFDALIDVGRGSLNKASHNFGADDPESERYRAFALVCLSEAARRHVIINVDKPSDLFQLFINYWTAMQAGESPPPPPFRVILGGKL